MDWISIKDRLPDKNGLYIVYIENLREAQDKKTNKYPIYQIELSHYEFGHFGYGCVSHWMPLPEKPK